MVSRDCEHLAVRLAGPVRVTLTRHRRERTKPPHDHEFACLHYVLRGLYVEHGPGEAVVAPPGSVLIKAAGKQHWNWMGVGDALCLRIEVRGESSTLDRLAGRSLSHRALPSARAVAMLEDIREAIHGDEDGPAFDWRGMVDALLAALATDGLAGETESEEPRTLAAARLLASQRGGWRVADVADRLRTDRCHLARQFQHRFGCSMSQYARWVRVGRVAAALAREDASLAGISLRAGFADQAHCTRSFARAMGTPPAAWARRRLSIN